MTGFVSLDCTRAWCASTTITERSALTGSLPAVAVLNPPGHLLIRSAWPGSILWKEVLLWLHRSCAREDQSCCQRK